MFGQPKAVIESAEEQAASVGIHHTTPIRHAEREPDFTEKVEQAEGKSIAIAETALMKNVKRGNPASVFLFLCNRARDRWQHVNRVELTGKDGGPIRYDEAIRRLDERRSGMIGGASVVRDENGRGGNGA